MHEWPAAVPRGMAARANETINLMKPPAPRASRAVHWTSPWHANTGLC